MYRTIYRSVYLYQSLSLSLSWAEPLDDLARGREGGDLRQACAAIDINTNYNA